MINHKKNVGYHTQLLRSPPASLLLRHPYERVINEPWNVPVGLAGHAGGAPPPPPPPPPSSPYMIKVTFNNVSAVSLISLCSTDIACWAASNFLFFKFHVVILMSTAVPPPRSPTLLCFVGKLFFVIVRLPRTHYQSTTARGLRRPDCLDAKRGISHETVIF